LKKPKYTPEEEQTMKKHGLEWRESRPEESLAKCMTYKMDHLRGTLKSFHKENILLAKKFISKGDWEKTTENPPRSDLTDDVVREIGNMIWRHELPNNSAGYMTGLVEVMR
jgi:hypothetical protein